MYSEQAVIHYDYLTISCRRRCEHWRIVTGLGDYSPIFMSPKATNCFSIITLMITRENKIIDQFPTPNIKKTGCHFENC